MKYLLIVLSTALYPPSSSQVQIRVLTRSTWSGRWIYNGDDVENIARVATIVRRSGDDGRVVVRVNPADYLWQPFACRLHHFNGEEAAACLADKTVIDIWRPLSR